MEEAAKQKTLSRKETIETLEVTAQTTTFDELDTEAKIALEAASEKKALDIVALDLRKITSFTEFFLIANGTNQRQVRAIADEILDKLKKQKKMKALRIEGYNAAEWVLLDYGDFVFHIFNSESRKFYDLERLWRDANKVELPEKM